MQNTEFINEQVYWLWLRCSSLKVSKQQFGTDGSLAIKVCYRWRITTNILPLYTWIKPLHKIQIIFSQHCSVLKKRHFCNCFAMSENFNSPKKCPAYPKNTPLFKASLSMKERTSRIFHTLPTASHICHHTCVSTSPSTQQEFAEA